MKTLLRLILRIYSVNQECVANIIRRMRRYKHRPKALPSPVQVPIHIIKNAPCCFVLSTGRCGTDLLTKLLAYSPMIDAAHVPIPELAYPSTLAYINGFRLRECYRTVVVHCRYEIIRASYLSGGIFVETNNRITFYAPFLAEVFQTCRFIHLIRNPADFTRSGLRRGYYSGHPMDEARIEPRQDDSVREIWDDISQTEKISWLWEATNRYVEEFKKTISKDRVLTIKAEDLFSQESTAIEVFNFIGVHPPSKAKIRKIITHPTNVQRKGDIPLYGQWADSQKDQLRRQTPSASYYGYAV